MEKEQILSTLNEKLGQISLSQRTISAYIGHFLPAEGTEPDDAYWEKHIEILNSLNGNYSADVAAFTEDYKKKHAPAADDSRKDDGEEGDGEVKRLRERIEELARKYEERESASSREKYLAKVKSEMKRQGASDDYVLRATLAKNTVDEKKSVDETARELLAAYDQEYTDCRGKGAAPRSGNSQGGAKDKPFGDFFKGKKAKLAAAKKQTNS